MQKSPFLNKTRASPFKDPGYGPDTVRAGEARIRGKMRAGLVV